MNFRIHTAGTILAFVALCCAAPNAKAQEMPAMEQPTAQHQWLQKFVGEWDSTVQILMDPENPVSVSVTETYRPLGRFWVVGEIVSQSPEMPFSGRYTIGFDSETEKFVGFWIESMTSNLARYEGSTDAAGRTLIMETEGKCPIRPGHLTKFREVTEFRDDNLRHVATFIQDDEGEWVQTVRIESRRNSGS